MSDFLIEMNLYIAGFLILAQLALILIYPEYFN